MLENAKNLLNHYEKAGLNEVSIRSVEEGFNILYEILTEAEFSKDTKRVARNIAERYVNKVVADVNNDYRLRNNIKYCMLALDSCDELNRLFGISDDFKKCKDALRTYISDNTTKNSYSSNYITYDEIAVNLMKISEEERNNILSVHWDFMSNFLEKAPLLRALGKISHQHPVPQRSDPLVTKNIVEIPMHIGRLTFPEGTEFKASYKGSDFYAKVANGTLSLDGRRFKSPSAAARHITGYETNGWIFWQFKNADDNQWILLDLARGR